MSEPIEYTFHKKISSFESILFILLYSVLNLILFVAYSLSLFSELSVSYIVVIEGFIVALLFIYLEVLYRQVDIYSRYSYIIQVGYSSINNKFVKQVQLFTIMSATFFIILPVVGFPLFIDQSLLYNTIAGLILLQSAFWMMIYYHAFGYQPEIDKSILDELDDESR